MKWHHFQGGLTHSRTPQTGCMDACMCAGCHPQIKTEQFILALRQSWFCSCIFWGYGFFYSMAFLLMFLFLTTIHPYESLKGKAKCLGDEVSAKTPVSQGAGPLRL